MSRKRPSVPVAYIRGGTSKALFFHERDVPPPGAGRDRFLRRIMGSPDALQIDGMGGSHVVTSKIALIKASERADADVDYTFVQVGIGNDIVGYTGNCGNISSGVGPFAIDEGLVKDARPGVSLDADIKTQEVRIYNTGTKKVLISHVPIDPSSGMSLEPGNFSISGCPGTGAPILMDYSNVMGGTLDNGALPTQTPVHTANVNGSDVEFTVCDVGNIIVFAKAEEMGIKGDEQPADLSNDVAGIVARVRELRGKAAQLLGMCKDWELVDTQSPMLPMVALVSTPTNPQCHIQSRLFLDNKCHTSMAGTGAICTAACSRIPGTVAHKVASGANLRSKTLEIQHPLGQIPVVVRTRPSEEAGELVPHFETLSFVRTSRRFMDGNLYVPEDVKDCFEGLTNGHAVTDGASATLQ